MNGLNSIKLCGGIKLDNSSKNSIVELLAKQDIFLGNNYKQMKSTFLFPGHGSQYPNMLKELIQSNKIVRDIFDEADQILSDMCGETLTSNILYSNEEEMVKVEKNISRAKIMQTSIFTANYAMYKLLESWGVKPDYMCGHSLGEISALTAADVVSFAEGFKIVFYRAESLERIPEEKRGGMVSVSLSKEDPFVAKLINEGKEKCVLALNNAQEQVVLSGSLEAVQEAAQTCKENNIVHSVLKVSHAFHSDILADAVEYYYEKIKDVTYREPKTSIYSTILNRLYVKEDFQNDFGRTLASQLVTPFSFCDIIKDMFKTLHVNVYFEVGCKNILTRLVKEILCEEEIFAIETNLKAKDDNLCIERVKEYMKMNNLEFKSEQVASESVENEIKKIIKSATSYPLDLITISDSPMMIDLALSKNTFAKIVKQIAQEFGVDENNINSNNISVKQIIRLISGNEGCVAPCKDVVEEKTTEPTLEVMKPVAKANVDRDGIEKKIKEIIAEKTGYPVEMLETDLDLEADLGIDSVKQGEIFGVVREYFGYAADENANIKEYNTIGKIVEFTIQAVGCSEEETEVPVEKVQTNISVDRDQIEKEIKEIIAQKTGYPEEMLESDLDLEADLGIDSVKQGEIFGVIREHFGYEADENANIKEYNTISKILEYTCKAMGGTNVETKQAEGQKKTVVIDKEEVEKKIKAIIAEKTGYPEEMLESDLDLEADLGIDSVKQGEIFGVVRESFGYELNENANVKDYNTISKIVAYTCDAMGSCEHSSNESEADVKEEMNPLFDYGTDTVTTRYMGIPVQKKYPEDAEKFQFQGKKVLLVEDRLSQDITRELVKLLTNEEVQICVLGNAKYEGVSSVEVDFKDSEKLKLGIQKAIELLGRVDVVINLNGLRKPVDFYTADYDSFDNEVNEVYNVIFYTSKYCYPYFEENPRESAYFAATNIGGVFGVERAFLHNPIGAIVDGYLKGLEKELRPLVCKICDFTETEDVKEVAKSLFLDYQVRESLVEIGYCNGYRNTVCVIPKEIKDREHIEQLKLSKEDVVLVSGGGRGIILECVKGLAALYNPVIVITGRTELPKGDEEWLSFDDEQMQNYKPVYMRKLMQEKKISSPIEAVEKFNKLLDARTLYKNLQELSHKGYQIHYVNCDICSDEDTDKLAKYIEDNYGKLTGIINGAGLPSFGRVPNKNEPYSLKVVRVKADGFYNMYNKFNIDKLKFFISMGSISGRFGMDGQVDYSAGADIIVKLTSMIKRDNPELKCAVLGWTAWDEVGMASDPKVKKIQQETRGLDYMGVKEGVTRFLNELAFGLNYPEVLYFGQIGDGNTPLGQLDLLEDDLKSVKQFIGAKGEITDKTFFPLLDTMISYKRGESIACTKKLDKETDIHLKDHLVEGSSVYAGVMHIESVVELGKLLQKLDNSNDGFVMTEINDYYFDKFIKYYDQNPLELKISGEFVESTEEKKLFHAQITSDFVNRKGMVLQKDRMHSYGDIVFEKSPKEVKIGEYDVQRLMKECQEIDMEQYYEKAQSYILFGETFRCIPFAGMINENEMIGTVKVPEDEQYFSFVNYVETLISPVTIDNIGRFMLLNDYQKNGYTIVPKKITKAIQYRKFRRNEEVYVYTKLNYINDTEISYSAQTIGKDGEVIFELIDMILTRIDKEDGNHNILK